MINVTKTFFPPLEEYEHQLKRIWENEWLTNRGELVRELEENLKAHLDISNIILIYFKSVFFTKYSYVLIFQRAD